MGDTAIVLELRFWHDYQARHQVRSAVAHEALARLDGAGVIMPFPTQELIITGEIDRPSIRSVPTDPSEA